MVKKGETQNQERGDSSQPGGRASGFLYYEHAGLDCVEASGKPRMIRMIILTLRMTILMGQDDSEWCIAYGARVMARGSWPKGTPLLVMSWET